MTLGDCIVSNFSPMKPPGIEQMPFAKVNRPIYWKSILILRPMKSEKLLRLVMLIEIFLKKLIIGFLYYIQVLDFIGWEEMTLPQRGNGSGTQRATEFTPMRIGKQEGQITKVDALALMHPLFNGRTSLVTRTSHFIVKCVSIPCVPLKLHAYLM